jgi:hypothetical protein
VTEPVIQAPRQFDRLSERAETPHQAHWHPAAPEEGNKMSFGISRRIGVSGAALGLVAAGAMALSAPASASPTSGTEYFTIDQQSVSGPGTVIATGFFDAAGSDTQRNSSDVLRFGNGKLVVAHPQSGVTSETFQANPNTCKFTFLQTGTYTLKNGTGAYAGLTGSGTYRASGEGLAARNPDGSCNFEGAPKAQIIVVHAHGPVSEGAAG